MKRILRITSILLIQAFLVMDFAWAGGDVLSLADITQQVSTLAPQLQISGIDFQNAYQSIRIRASADQPGSEIRPESRELRYLGKAKIGGEKDKEFWVGRKTGKLWIFKINPYPQESYRPQGVEVYYKFLQRYFGAKQQGYETVLDNRRGTLELALLSQDADSLDWRQMNEDTANQAFQKFALPNLKKKMNDGEFSPVSLSDAQRDSLLEQMVIDWLFSNHDAHPANFVIESNGNIIGIDKEQVFKYFLDDRLSLDYLPNGANFAPLYYLLLSSLAFQGKLDIELLRAVIDKINNIPEQELRALITPFAAEYAKQHSKRFSDSEAFISAFLERRGNLEKDFIAFFEHLNNVFSLDIKSVLTPITALNLDSFTIKDYKPIFDKITLPEFKIKDLDFKTDFMKRLGTFVNIDTANEGIQAAPSRKELETTGFNQQPGMNEELAGMYGVDADLLQRIRDAGDDPRAIEALIDERFDALIANADDAEAAKLQEVRAKLKGKIRSPTPDDNKLKVILRLLSSWIAKLRESKADSHRIYLARDGGFFYLIDKALTDLRGKVSDYDRGASVYHLSRARMTWYVYSKMHDLIVQAKGISGNDISKLYRNIRREFQKLYASDARFRSIVDAVGAELAVLGYDKIGKVVFTDTGFVGTIPFFLKNVLDLGKKEEELFDEAGEELVQVAVIQPSSIMGFARALFGFDLDMLDPGEQRLIRSLAAEFDQGRQVGGHLEEIKAHPISFNEGKQLIEAVSLPEQLEVFYEQIIAVQMAIAYHERRSGVEQTVNNLPPGLRGVLSSLIDKKDFSDFLGFEYLDSGKSFSSEKFIKEIIDFKTGSNSQISEFSKYLDSINSTIKPELLQIKPELLENILTKFEIPEVSIKVNEFKFDWFTRRVLLNSNIPDFVINILTQGYRLFSVIKSLAAKPVGLVGKIFSRKSGFWKKTAIFYLGIQLAELLFPAIAKGATAGISVISGISLSAVLPFAAVALGALVITFLLRAALSEYDNQDSFSLSLKSQDEISRLNASENRAKRANMGKSGFSLISAVKNTILSAILLVSLVIPFAGFSFSGSAEARAPPQVSTVSMTDAERQMLQKKFVEISENFQLDRQGNLRTLKANLSRQDSTRFSNFESRVRAKNDFKRLIEWLYEKKKQEGTLDDFITKRGDSKEARAIGLGLLAIQAFNENDFESFKNEDPAIFLAEFGDTGGTRGSNVGGMGGRPLIRLNMNNIDYPFMLSVNLSHELVHARALPRTLLEAALKYNLITLIHDLFGGWKAEELDAFDAERIFIEKSVKIVPINGKNFFGDGVEDDLTGPYYSTWQRELLNDFAGMVYFNFVPIFGGWLIVTWIKSSRMGRTNSRARFSPQKRQVMATYRSDYARGLRNQRVSNWQKFWGFTARIISRLFFGRGRGNRFRSFIFFAAALQILNSFNPANLQAGQAVNITKPAAVAAEYIDEYKSEIIPGTNISIHTHTGPQQGKHNNVLGDWAEASITGVLASDADLLRFDWHADEKPFLKNEDLQQWQEVQNIEDKEEKIQAARDIAANLRIDSFNYPAYLTGPVGRPLLGNTYWIRQNAEWQAAPLTENMVFAFNIMFLTNNPQDYPDRRKLNWHNLNAEDLALLDESTQVKDGFVLDFDLDYFSLYREDVNWDYLETLLQSNDPQSIILAQAMQREGFYQPAREQIQNNIDMVLQQLSLLAEKGKRPAVITIADSPGFTPKSDARWIKEQLVNGLKRIYGKDASITSEETGKVSAVGKAKGVGMLAAAGLVLSDLFSAVSSLAADGAIESAAKGFSFSFMDAVLTAVLIFAVFLGARVVYRKTRDYLAQVDFKAMIKNIIAQTNETATVAQTTVQANAGDVLSDGFTETDWLNILAESGLQGLNIKHTRRNVLGEKYFSVKEKLSDRQKEILETALWLHDITKDDSLDEYIPENKKLSGTLRLLVHHFEAAEYAEELLRDMGYDEDFIKQVKNIILTHMGPITGRDRKGFMEFLRSANIESISLALESSGIRQERKEKLQGYVKELEESGFASPETELENIARDIDILDLSGDGIVKVITFRQTDPGFFIRVTAEDEFSAQQLELLYDNGLIKQYEDSWRFPDKRSHVQWTESTEQKLAERLRKISGADVEGIIALWQRTAPMPETLEKSFESAMMTAEDVGLNLKTYTAKHIAKHRLTQLNIFKANVDLRAMEALPEGANLEKFQAVYNEFMAQAKLFYDAVLEGADMPLDKSVDDIAEEGFSSKEEIEAAELKLSDKSRVCDLPNRQRYIEDLVKGFQEGNRIQVAFLSIQNFKEEFNDVGAQLDNVAGTSILGHEFGDYAIQAMAGMLRESITDLLEFFEYKNVSFKIYNDAKSYWVVFENVPQNFDPRLIFDKMFEEYSDFRAGVVNEVKARSEQKSKHLLAIGDLTPEQVSTIRLGLAQMSWRNFNIYAGISSAMEVKSMDTMGAVAAADTADSQAILTAKYEQIGLGGEDLRRMITRNLEEKDLRLAIITYVDQARKAQVSRVGVYDESIIADVEIHKKYGQKGEWEPMYRPVWLTYDENTTFEKLFAAYDKARQEANPAMIKQAKEAIFKKISFAALDPSVEVRAKRPVFYGNERFSEIIDHIILNRPGYSWSGTFRIGGDEFGKVIWNAQTGELVVLRFDINNLGKVNIQWGVSIGDKVIDEMSVLFDEIEDYKQLMERIYDYFSKDMPEGDWLKLEYQDFLYIRDKLKAAGKNVYEYIIADNMNRYFLKRIPPVIVEVIGENGEVKGVYESTPAVSVGVVRINTNIIHSQKNMGEDINRDYSQIQGRADARAEEVKTFLKEEQAKNNGTLSNAAFQEANKLMDAAEYKPGALKSFKSLLMTPVQVQLAEFMLKEGLPRLRSEVQEADIPVEPEQSERLLKELAEIFEQAI